MTDSSTNDENKYGTLKTLVFLGKIIAGTIGGLAVLQVLEPFVTGSAITIASLLTMAGGLFGAVFIFSVFELITVIIDIERNTRCQNRQKSDDQP